MTRKVISVKPDTPVVDAANTMLQQHISGLPVVNETGKLVGIIPKGDFLRRAEIGNAAEARPVAEISGQSGSGCV
jgi:CBS domain-containing protein